MPPMSQWHNDMMSITICVFCGSRPGSNPSWSTATRQLGSAIAEHGWRLVFGGGGGGLMGELARGAIAAHGTVIVGVLVYLILSRSGPFGEWG